MPIANPDSWIIYEYMNLPQIVLVDDEPAILELQQAALGTVDLAVAAFQRPAEAWQYLQQHPEVRLLVTDWEMPEMTGMDLFFKVRGLPRPPRVIFVTGHGSVNRAVQALSQGASNFSEKPFLPEAFVVGNSNGKNLI